MGIRLSHFVYALGSVYGCYLVFHTVTGAIKRKNIREREKDLIESCSESLNASDATDSAKAAALKKRFSSLIVAGRFANPFQEYRDKGFIEFICWNLFVTLRGPIWGSGSGVCLLDQQELDRNLPVHDVDLALASAPSSNAVKVTWLGQSCVHAMVNGLSVLTDPIFSNHLVNSFGPKRLRPAPCPAELLPIDIVLVSHNHPDHLDLESCSSIGNRALWIVPLGVRKILAQRGVYNIIEMDWWQELDVTDYAATPGGRKCSYKVVCTPAMHWSGRKLFDKNWSLWCSFMICKDDKPVLFHAGDTGYQPEMFKAIREVLGPCSLAIMPCGAYKPRWHLCGDHMDPSESLKAAEDLGAEKVIGVHWGTFIVTDEFYLEPRDLFNELGAERGIKAETLEFGDCKEYIIDH
ncbi:hypothetical protein CANCADRAFT_32577 [Tortispora caseinolytica NRRL Y-17796]|uniref:Metallo-beta-lactamase domain-containing protein n=1 Tax=Tortispora caseinolytica NRRL Y-17796 TaxID=767744 RepID=A0A1E4TBY0_9ASCO|nr:hypothetical protein CANCADRAFT_32577 [Tortispora caseinolytica NRRL Y-17796]